MRGIFRYLLHQGQREKKEIRGILSPDKLVEDKTTPRPMFNAALRESIKCGLLVEQEILINPIPEDARNLLLGDKLLPDILTHLFFASNHEDEEDFGRVCAWYLAQEIYEEKFLRDFIAEKDFTFVSVLGGSGTGTHLIPWLASKLLQYLSKNYQKDMTIAEEFLLYTNNFIDASLNKVRKIETLEKSGGAIESSHQNQQFN